MALRTEFGFCSWLVEKNEKLWICKTQKSKPTVQGARINTACKLLAALMMEGAMNISASMQDIYSWLESVGNAHEIYSKFGVKIFQVYNALCTNIPFEVTVLWCIRATNNGVPDVLGRVITNTPMVSYLVGDEIYSSWDSFDIATAIELLHTVRSCYDLTLNMEDAVKNYYTKNPNTMS